MSYCVTVLTTVYTFIFQMPKLAILAQLLPTTDSPNAATTSSYSSPSPPYTLL